VLDPEIQTVLDAMPAEPGAEDVPIAELRQGHEEETARWGGPPPEVAEVRDDALPTPSGPVPVRRYRPVVARGTVAYLHGGGWCVGSLDSYDIACRALALASGAEVVSIAYRLAPEHPYPAGLEDALAAIRALASEGAPLAVGGDSAGGNLAAVAARRLRGVVPLRAQALIYPVADAATDTPSYRAYAEGHGLTAGGMRRYWQLYLDGADALAPDASPLRADDLAGVAPALVLTAEEDVLRDEGEAYAAALAHAGVPVEHRRVEGTIHGFWRWQGASRLAREAVADLGAGLRAALDEPPGPGWTAGASGTR
jgi:acetyl esterase/lipase